MSKSVRFATAASCAVIASLIAGCAAPQGRMGSASMLGGKSRNDVGLATRALAALNSDDVSGAVSLAERAVEKTPDSADFRALLGNAYFTAGRFASAEAAYEDALAIASNQPQVILKLALVQIAQGKSAEAVALLEAGRTMLDPADFGLALALAGGAVDAIPVLESAARVQGADARVRQNLALAYAFAGNWRDARTIAAQDVPADQLDARLQQWMQLAKPARASDQVAALTGITPAATDPGQPTRLALHRPEIRVAEAAPVSAPAPVVQPPVEAVVVSAAEPIAAPVAVAEPPVVEVAPPPPPVVAEAPVPLLAPAPVLAPKVAAAKPVRATLRRAAAPAQPVPIRQAVLRRGQSDVVVQLGAYKSPQAVTEAWERLTQSYPALRTYLPLRARFDSPKGTFWRLSIQGFGSQREALARCQVLRSRGGNCFVRSFAGDAPIQIALR